MKFKEVSIVKSPSENPFNIYSSEINFEEFDELYLTDLEDKKKIKPRKRSEAFDYKKFHEKLKRRYNNVTPSTQVTLLKSPPTNKSPQTFVVDIESAKSKTNYKSLEDYLETATAVNSNVIQNPIVYKSPVKTPFFTTDNKNLPNPLVYKSPIKSPKSLLKLDTIPIESLGSVIKLGPKTPESLVNSVVKGGDSPSKSFIKSIANIEDTYEEENNYSIKSVHDSLKIHSASLVASIKKCKTPIPTPRQSLEKNKNSPVNLSLPESTVPESIGGVYSPNSEISYVSDDAVVNKTVNSHNLSISDKSFNSDIVHTKSLKNISIIRTVNYQKNSFKSDIVNSDVHRLSANSNLSTESCDDEKRELLFKFQLLASKHPTLVAKYPFTMRSNLKVMKNTYALILKQISVTNRVNNLNTYMLAGFMLVEYGFGKLGFDMEGFSKHQIASMKSYESLLIELGEKEYSPYGMDTWCVEVRLLATLMFNAVWFIVAKSISKKTNFDILGLISSSSSL